jgi:hypothetical protein
MPSESVIMSSAAEARFRVQAPNSTPRAVTVIALDARSEPVVRRLADHSWNRASFFVSNGTLSDLSGQAANLDDAVAKADLIVMVAAAGGHAEAATAIGRASSERRVMTTALIIETATAPEAALSRTLAQVRPWALMVVMAEDDEYIEDMLTALRA